MKERNSEPAVDPQVIGGLRRMAEQSGQMAMFRRLINEFLEEAEEALLGMENALRGEDFRQLQAHAHALKGSAAQIGAMELSEMARDVEEAAKRDRSRPAVAPLDNALSELHRVRAVLVTARDRDGADSAEPAA